MQLATEPVMVWIESKSLKDAYRSLDQRFLVAPLDHSYVVVVMDLASKQCERIVHFENMAAAREFVEGIAEADLAKGG